MTTVGVKGFINNWQSHSLLPATAPSKMLLVTVNSGQFPSCCIIGTGGCSRTALGLTSGSCSLSTSNNDSSCSASSARPWVAAVRYARDPTNHSATWATTTTTSIHFNRFSFDDKMSEHLKNIYLSTVSEWFDIWWLNLAHKSWADNADYHCLHYCQCQIVISNNRVI